MTSVNEAARDVEEARRDLRRKLDALSERATLSNLASEASHYFNMGDGRAFAHNLGHQIKANPMAALMLGLGVGWMMMSRRDGNGEALHLEGAAESARRTAESARSAAIEGGHRAGHALSSTAHEAAVRTRHFSESLAESFERQPLVYGGAAFVLGSALSALLAPPTDYEERHLGEVGAEAHEKAESYAREGMERAESAAAAAYEAGKSEVEQEFGSGRQKPGQREPEKSASQG
jgi:hypothetical protein